MSINLNGNVVYHGKEYNCAQLRGYKEWLRELICKNCSVGKPVAIAIKRNPGLLVAMFALLDEKVPFLPIDLSFPRDRLAYMLDKAEIDTVISDEEGVSVLGREMLYVDLKISSEQYVSDGKNEVDVQEEEDKDALAYLLFTSGTTGLPKAVQVKRQGLINFIQGISEIVSFPQYTRIACLTSQTFDIFFLESVMALALGMTVILADEDERANPRMLARLIENNSVNVMQSTPSALRMLQMIDDDLKCLKDIEVIMVGGEKFPLSLLKELQKAVKGEIYNMYGPTETTIWSMVANLTREDEINIGHPIKATQIYIVDDELKEVPQGEEGEILIAGDGLARGYCNDPEKTDRQFVYIEKDSKKIRVYKTGDFGCLCNSGVYKCNGRKDDQVKFLGHRIEFGDIEGNIQKIDGIENAMVVLVTEAREELICFYLAETDLKLNFLSREAQNILPKYMLPNRWIRVPQFFYTASQKADRKKMIEIYYSKQERFEEAENSNKLEKTDEMFNVIINSFQLFDEDINLDTEIIRLGMDSIQYVERMIDIEAIFDIEFEDYMLTEGYFKTIGDLVKYLKEISGFEK